MESRAVSVIVPRVPRDHPADATAGAVARRASVEVIVAADRNEGLAASTAAMAIFLGANDRLLPGGIDAGVRALTERPDCSMAYGRAAMIDPDGRVPPVTATPTVRAGHHAAFLRANLIPTIGSVIFRRDALVQLGGFREQFGAAADHDLYLRVACAGGICDHEQTVAAYPGYPARLNGSSARMLRDTLKMMRANRPDGDSRLIDAWTEGYDRLQDFFGTELADEIRRDFHRHRFRTAAWKTAILVSLAPAVCRRELHNGVDVGRSCVVEDDGAVIARRG